LRNKRKRGVETNGRKEEIRCDKNVKNKE